MKAFIFIDNETSIGGFTVSPKSENDLETSAALEISPTIDVRFHLSPQEDLSYSYNRCVKNVAGIDSVKTWICPIIIRISAS